MITTRIGDIISDSDSNSSNGGRSFGPSLWTERDTNHIYFDCGRVGDCDRPMFLEMAVELASGCDRPMFLGMAVELASGCSRRRIDEGTANAVFVNSVSVDWYT